MNTNVHRIEPLPRRPPDPPADQLISESEVLVYRPVLGPGLLRGARKSKTIKWTKGRRGSAWYKLADVDAFIATRELPCHAPEPDPYSNSPDNGLPKNLGGAGYTASGMTPELAESVALASAQRILKLPSGALQKSS